MDEKLYPEIHKALQFRCNKIDEIKTSYLIKETREIEILSTKHNKYITTSGYVEKTLLALSVVLLLLLHLLPVLLRLMEK